MSDPQPRISHQPPQQFIILNPQQAPAVRRRAPAKVEYAADNVKTVRCLTLCQLVVGVVIFVFHSATTAINDHFFNQKAILDSTHDINLGYWLEGTFVDHAATGIWVGILIILTASIGLGGAKYQKKGMIITHLVLNVFILLIMIALLITVPISISALRDCRNNGLTDYSYDRYDSGYYYDSHGNRQYYSTTTSKTVEFLGETLYKGRYGWRFHCSAHLFKAWLAMDAIVLVAAVLGWIITLTLLIYNSRAACRSCCCGCCCPSVEHSSDNNAVAYYSQPTHTMAPTTPATTPIPTQQVYPPQQVFAPPQYQYQPTPLYTQPTANPLPVQVVTQPGAVPLQPGYMVAGAHATPVTTQPSATPAGATAEEAKWEELPPEYAEVFQNAQNQASMTQTQQ